MKEKDNRKRWYELMQDYEQSGKSAKAWCSVNGISPSTFKYWRYRARIQDTYQCKSQHLPSGWLEATLPPTPQAGMISIVIGGAKIIVERGFDSLLLREVVESLS